MLCLTRAPGTSIKIGDNVVMTIMEVKQNGHVKIAFDAPPAVKIFRTELLDREEEACREGDKQ